MAIIDPIVMLVISVVTTCVAMFFILRSWWKTRLLPTALYSIAIACFTGLTIGLILDVVWEPYSAWMVFEGEMHPFWASQ